MVPVVLKGPRAELGATLLCNAPEGGHLSESCLGRDALQRSAALPGRHRSLVSQVPAGWSVWSDGTGTLENVDGFCQGILDALGKRFDNWDNSLSLVVAANTQLNVAEINLRR